MLRRLTRESRRYVLPRIKAKANARAKTLNRRAVHSQRIPSHHIMSEYQTLCRKNAKEENKSLLITLNAARRQKNQQKECRWGKNRQTFEHHSHFLLRLFPISAAGQTRPAPYTSTASITSLRAHFAWCNNNKISNNLITICFREGWVIYPALKTN